VCAGQEDWADPCNWIVDGVRGAGVPGTNDLDKVVIYGAQVGTYPTNAVGRIAELLMKGSRAAPNVLLGAPDLTVLERIYLEIALLGTPRAPLPTRVTLAKTGRLISRSPGNFAITAGVGYNATLDNFGKIEAPQGAFKVSGRINNYGLIEME